MLQVGRVVLSLGMLSAMLPGASEQELYDRLSAEHTDRKSIAEYIAQAPVSVAELGSFAHMAAHMGQDDAVRACLDAGLDPKVKDSDGEPLLRTALAGKASDQLIEELIKRGADPKQKDAQGNDLVIIAARAKRTALTLEMLDLGCDVHAVGLGLVAAREGEISILERLVHDGLDPSSLDNGSTWLHSAAHYGKVEAVRWLLEHGADPRRKNAQGETPLEAAEQPVSQAYRHFDYPIEEGKKASVELIKAAIGKN